MSALIPFQTFFQLLTSKQLSVATFIRTPEELDIFHEFFGHCPVLTNPWFTELTHTHTHTYDKLGLAASIECGPQQQIFASLEAMRTP